MTQAMTQEQPQRWIKVSGPGEFRGQGVWTRFEDLPCTEDYWDYCKSSGFLPTHEGDAPPSEDQP